MVTLKSLTESGTSFAQTREDQRNVLLTNYISLIAVAATLLLLAGRFFFAHVDLSIALTLLLGSGLFFVPIFLNRAGFIRASGIALCWIPTAYQLFASIQTMHDVSRHEASLYVGLRFFMIAFSCFPFLVFDFKRPLLFVVGLLGPIATLFLFDPILNFFGVGFYQVNLTDTTYYFNNVRAFISFMIIGASLYILKSLVLKNEKLNDELVRELDSKNKLIQQQADEDVRALNVQLKENLDQSRERELILSQSQRIAKIGSWEFRSKNNSIFWSDEMYNIFGLDKGFDLQAENNAELLWGDHSAVVRAAHEKILKEGGSYNITISARTPLAQTKWVRLYAHAVWEEGKIIGASGICHDITFYKEAEELARKSERNYRALFEQASDSIMMTDFTGKFIDVNTSLCNLLGYKKEELLFMNIADVLDPQELNVNPIAFDRLPLGEHIFSERQMVRKDGSRVPVEANVKIFGDGIIMAIARDATMRKSMENEKEKARHSLNERVKELTTLYKCSQILQIEKKPIHEALQEIVDILPAGWQFPAITEARITFAGMEFVTPNFVPATDTQFAEFHTRNNLYGTVEVAYIEARPDEIEGPFLAEERNLINMIADMIRIYLSRRYEAEALKLTEANQSATINNTNFFIWSVNLQFELISFNKPFAEFVKRRFGINATLGYKLSEQTEELIALRNQWETNYIRALAGETFKVNRQIDERHFEYSLNPIIEEGEIVGVSVFGEDISERVQHQKEMLAVNKQIGELRLMALRSVMNPHFIFNSLNSIQYYILENDQRNAVVYLSTFSKLIRAILNNSVKSRVRLSEELEMLRHYIQLESIRFENKFTSVFEIDPNIDVESIEIPSMLIQPYVENSILHGLNNKKEKGLLKISVRSENDMILVEVEDNGVGREAASKFKQATLPQHKSMGTALTEERLKLINADDSSSVEIIDLEANGVQSGTLVRVWIKE